jgi:uroporphyrin-III C-methyltransferase/precorrin-2 dehydrogenase/sirohydrochlorin ferrochelatase
VFADVEPAALLGYEPERLDPSRQTSRLQAKAV